MLLVDQSEGGDVRPGVRQRESVIQLLNSCTTKQDLQAAATRNPQGVCEVERDRHLYIYSIFSIPFFYIILITIYCSYVYYPLIEYLYILSVMKKSVQESKRLLKCYFNFCLYFLSFFQIQCNYFFTASEKQ